MPIVSSELEVLLFVPGNRPDRFSKAAASGADAIILDLEDAVPDEDKERARLTLSEGFAAKPVFVRVNGVGTSWHEQDMLVATTLPFSGLILPKAELDDCLVQICQSSKIPVLPIIETAKGLAAARTIASLPNVERLVFGSIDFSADVGCAHVRDSLLAARSELVIASRLAELKGPIDGVTTAINDSATVLDDAVYARKLGFNGKLAIHPAQIVAIREGFRPTEDEIRWARNVLAGGPGAVKINDCMIDEPVRLRARAILSRIR